MGKLVNRRCTWGTGSHILLSERYVQGDTVESGAMLVTLLVPIFQREVASGKGDCGSLFVQEVGHTHHHHDQTPTFPIDRTMRSDAIEARERLVGVVADLKTGSDRMPPVQMSIFYLCCGWMLSFCLSESSLDMVQRVELG